MKNQGGLREKRITPVLQKELLKYLVYNAQNDPALVVRTSDFELNCYVQSALNVGKIILKEMHWFTSMLGHVSCVNFSSIFSFLDNFT